MRWRSDGHRRGAGSRSGGARRRPDRLRHAVGHQQFSTAASITTSAIRTLNSNYYFNKIHGLERNDVDRSTSIGGRVGGPIVIPGLFDGRTRRSSSSTMEEFYQPTEASRTRTILHPRRRRAGSATTPRSAAWPGAEVNLLDARAGERPARDARSRHAAAARQSAPSAATTGAVTDLTNPNTQQYFYQSAGTSRQHAPTGARRHQPLSESPAERILLLAPAR